ncbi:hypothetical protein G4B88_006787 [Cannabis sativa]|uniref:Uncharacterized protein n=1 Tax=Cannabis sativa TaxID=3483 RepID=A0A7J6GUP7_CANSA|nr:hypothetical protein G4B88_006787 [Cannabis sativa]
MIWRDLHNVPLVCFWPQLHCSHSTTSQKGQFFQITVPHVGIPAEAEITIEMSSSLFPFIMIVMDRTESQQDKDNWMDLGRELSMESATPPGFPNSSIKLHHYEARG